MLAKPVLECQANPMLSVLAQQEIFNGYCQRIDRELRATGFEEILSAEGVDCSVGRLAIGRSFTYSDDGPLGLRLETIHEVGIVNETVRSNSWSGFIIAQATHGERQKPTGLGDDLDHIQFVTAESLIDELLYEKAHGLLPFLTKDLRRIDLFF